VKLATLTFMIVAHLLHNLRTPERRGFQIGRSTVPKEF
jgi:hypothetical protein